MPRLRQKARQLGAGDIAVLKKAFRSGLPWTLYQDGFYRQCPLPTRISILLSYLTGVTTLGVLLGAEPHPSKQTVRSMKAVLKDDIKAGEEEFGHFFKGKKRSYAFFADPGSMPREFF